jgi:hypothetical protein
VAAFFAGAFFFTGLPGAAFLETFLETFLPALPGAWASVRRRLSAACAAAWRAMGSRYGEQET